MGYQIRIGLLHRRLHHCSTDLISIIPIRRNETVFLRLFASPLQIPHIIVDCFTLVQSGGPHRHAWHIFRWRGDVLFHIFQYADGVINYCGTLEGTQ